MMYKNANKDWIHLPIPIVADCCQPFKKEDGKQEYEDSSKNLFPAESYIQS